MVCFCVCVYVCVCGHVCTIECKRTHMVGGVERKRGGGGGVCTHACSQVKEGHLHVHAHMLMHACM